MDGAIDLVLRVMSKTMDSTTLGSEKREFAPLPALVIENRSDESCDDSRVRDSDARARDEGAESQDLQARGDRRVAAEAGVGQEGRGHRDEVERRLRVT